MLVFYYLYDGRARIVCVRGRYPGRLSPIWSGCNTCVLMVPGTGDYDDDDELRPDSA